jgi:hypothetical protein
LDPTPPPDPAAPSPAFIDRWKPRQIGRQIGVGYFLAIAIGWTGSIAGMVIADYFQGLGFFQLLDAQNQAQLLNRYEQVADQVQLLEL